MGDLKDDYKAMNDDRKERHAAAYKVNLEILNASGIPFEIQASGCLFREKGKPKVDFFPHTGRWVCLGKVRKGGAERFLEWYRKFP